MMLEDNITVTIRCLAYNHEAYIRKCLDGFVMQKTRFRYEALVHDDKSTDATVDIIREYAAKYPDIIKPVLEKENQFKKHDGSIRKLMDSLTKGKYVAICEGDDYWTDPYKLQKQVDFLESHPDFSMCYHNAIVDGGSSKRLFLDLNIPSRTVSLADMLEKWSIPSASVVYRRDRCIYPSDYPEFLNGDYAQEIFLMSKGDIFYMADIMSVYKLHSDSLSAWLSNNQLSLFRNLIDLLSYMKNVFPDASAPAFDAAIDRYRQMILRLETDAKYPFLKYLNWRYYKRLLFKKLRITRTPS